MGGGHSKKAYKPEKLDDHSGIDLLPHSFPQWWRETTYSDARKRTEERLIQERQEQIRGQFSDKRVQKEYDIFRGLWAPEGELTKAYDGDEAILTSDQWPESVKAVTTEGLEAAFGRFRVNHNAVLRTYQHFRDEEGAVSMPYGFGDVNPPRCAEKNGTCPEWRKSFKHQFEGELPADIRELKGEGLDRFNRYMLMKGERQVMDKAEAFTDMVPVVGTVIRATECATERDAGRRAQQCMMAGVGGAVDAVTLGLGGVAHGAAAVATNAVVGAGGGTLMVATGLYDMGEAVPKPEPGPEPEPDEPASEPAAPAGAAPEQPKPDPEPVMPDPVKSHLPDDSVQYNHDLVHAPPDDRYTIDVTAGSRERQDSHVLGVAVLLLAGGAVYYAYRRLT